MMKGDETRGVVACAFDGCTGALPGQGHGVEPPTALYRQATQLSAPIVHALTVGGRVRVLLLQGRKPNQALWWDQPVAHLAMRHVDLTASTLEHAPDIVGVARPSPASTFGINNAKVMAFEFPQLGGEPKYLVKLPELSESGATMSPCFAHCPRRALRNAHEIAFVELFASALLTRAQGPPRALREHGVVQLTERRWPSLGDEDDAKVEWVEGFKELRGSGSCVGHANRGEHREVQVSFKCPNGHVFWHEHGNYNNQKTTAATATTIQVGVTKAARRRVVPNAEFCDLCKLGSANCGGSSVTVHFSLDGTCECRWRGGQYVTEGRWHDTRSATTEERDSLCCSLCEELLE
jgi:hypothetical protein